MCVVSPLNIVPDRGRGGGAIVVVFIPARPPNQWAKGVPPSSNSDEDTGTLEGAADDEADGGVRPTSIATSATSDITSTFIVAAFVIVVGVALATTTISVLIIVGYFFFVLRHRRRRS